MNAKVSEKVHGKTGCLHSPEISSKYFLITKGKKGNFTVRKPGRHHLGYQVINVNTTSYKTWANIRQTQNERHATEHLKQFFKSVKVMKGKERQRNHHRSEATKKTWQLMQCGILDWILEQNKDTSGIKSIV